MINNDFYNNLHTDWLDRLDHPVALLRAENKVRAPWILSEIENRLGNATVLDVGCGAGFLANFLQGAGLKTTGIDLSVSSLEIARKTGSAQFFQANAYQLPFPAHSFDVVLATDVLEHVEEPSLLIAESSRVLRPGGLFFFHTFNRTFWSYLLVIKGVEWFVRNTPKNMHVYPLFLRPHELEEMLHCYDLNAICWKGLRPTFSRAMWKLALTRIVPSDFSFRFTRSLKTGYCGIAQKR